MALLLRGYPSRDSSFLCDDSIPPVHYRTVVKTFGSTPADQDHLASPPFPLLRSVSLLLACSHSVPAPAGLGDQEPGLPWQLVQSLSLDGSSLDCVPHHLPLPTMHIQNRHTHQLLHLCLFQQDLPSRRK